MLRCLKPKRENAKTAVVQTQELIRVCQSRSVGTASPLERAPEVACQVTLHSSQLWLGIGFQLYGNSISSLVFVSAS